jgi:phenylalanyl-tRNA synthetase beta chain
VRAERVNRLLGSDLKAGEMVHLLEPIGFKARRAEHTARDLDVIIPSWRYDSSTEIDVVEEIARLHGYSNLGRTVPSSAHTGRLTPRQRERRQLRAVLVGLGLSEAMPMPFLAPGDLERFGLPAGIEIANPLDAKESILRTSLLPGLVDALATNAARRNTGVQLWEIGHVFLQPADTASELPDEREHLGAALGGQDATAAVHVWRAVEESLAVPGIRIVNATVAGLHPTRAARLVGPDDVVVGHVGEVDPGVLESQGIGERVGWLQLDLDRLLALPHGETRYRPISRYPSSDIDLAFEVDEAVPATDVEATLRSAAGDRLAWIRLFDVYRGAGISGGRRSLAYTLRLEAQDHTLTDADVAETRQACIDAVQSAHPAILRG